MNEIKFGSIVKLKVPCMGNDKGDLGIVYDIYEDFDNDNEIGVCVILKNGEYCGYSYDEQHQFFEFVKQSDLHYIFQNVMQLSLDYDYGLFDQYIK